MDGNSKEKSGLDTDVTIAISELSCLIPDLIEALGDEGRTAMGDLPASLATSTGNWPPNPGFPGTGLFGSINGSSARL